MNKLRKGDKVIVLKGRSKGHIGVVKQFIAKDKLLVEGANIVSKCVKANPRANEKGGINKIEAPINISNVAIVNPTTGQKDRVVIKSHEGKNARYFASNGEMVDAGGVS